MRDERRESVFNASPWRAIASLSVPSLISVVVMLLYNMADMYFVGWMKDVSQVAAVSLAMPVFTVMMAISTMIGNGGCTRIAQAMGQRDGELVRRCTALCFWASMVFGLVIAVLCAVAQDPLLRFLGASEETWLSTRDYVLILTAGAPVILLNHSIGGMLRGEGLVKVGLLGSMISTLANIALDPVFILVLGMGVRGAAVATVLGNALAIAYYFIYRARHRTECVMELDPRQARDLGLLGGILALGLPNAISSTLSGFAGSFSNQLLSGYGTGAVAAMASASKGTMLVTMVQMGVCMGVQPLLAYCYGGKDWERLKGILLRLLGLTVGLGTVLTLVIWVGRDAVVGLFIHDAEVAAMGARFMGVLLIMGPVIGIYYLAANFLQAGGNALAASVASALRQGLLLIPLLYMMNATMGLDGLPTAHLIADGVSVVIALCMALVYYRRIGKGA